MDMDMGSALAQGCGGCIGGRYQVWQRELVCTARGNTWGAHLHTAPRLSVEALLSKLKPDLRQTASLLRRGGGRCDGMEASSGKDGGRG